MGNSAAGSAAVADTPETKVKDNAFVKKAIKEADVTTIPLGLSKKAAEYIKGRCGEDEIGKALVKEINEAL